MPLIYGAGALLALIAVVALLSWRADGHGKNRRNQGDDGGSPSYGRDDAAACADSADASCDGGGD